MRIKGFFKDLMGFFKVNDDRKAVINEASDIYTTTDNVLTNQQRLHPGIIKSKVLNIQKETTNSVRIRFEISKDIIIFAGSYISLKLNINGSYLARPYSIITSSKEAKENDYIEIIVKEKEDGFVSKYLNHDLKVGDEIDIELNQGEFTYNSIRDQKDVVFIAGGVGITPFISLSKDLLERDVTSTITIIYGIRNRQDILAKQELDDLVKQNVKVIYVVSDEPDYQGEKGFINNDIINKYIKDINKVTFFMCGPSIMIDYVKNELDKLGVDLRKVRAECHLEANIKETEECTIEVHRGLDVQTIKALSNESVLVALEKSGIKHESSCRSGRCGYCHIKVIKGDYFLLDDSYIRHADKELGYVHSCVTYPKSDLVIRIAIE